MINNEFSFDKKIYQIYHLACSFSSFYQNKPLATLNTCYIGSKNVIKIANDTLESYLQVLLKFMVIQL